MRLVLKALGVAGLLAASTGVASAQGFDLRVGVGEIDSRPRHIERRVYRDFDDDVVVRRRVIDRRVVAPARTRTVCRTVVRERVTPAGIVVRRPTEVCRQVVTSRRVYVD